MKLTIPLISRCTTHACRTVLRRLIVLNSSPVALFVASLGHSPSCACRRGLGATALKIMIQAPRQPGLPGEKLRRLWVKNLALRAGRWGRLSCQYRQEGLELLMTISSWHLMW